MIHLDISITDAGLRYAGASEPVFSNLNLQLEAGQWTCLLGSSGCGKTSLLRMLAGLIGEEHQTSGTVQDQHGQPLGQRIAYMAQQDLLLPWLTVLDNVCLKARLSGGKPDAQTYAKAHQLLEQLGLADTADQRPEALSGGMRQRVALARTLMQDTPVVLMDEPFSALDAVTRHRLQNIAVEALQGRTVLLITHDPQEALRLGDKVWLFNQQQLQAIETPATSIPRQVDAELGRYQQGLLSALQNADSYTETPAVNNQAMAGDL